MSKASIIMLHKCLQIVFSSIIIILLTCPGQVPGQSEDGFLYDKFPTGFEWGFATASYQIEGGWNASGKGPNIWDEWTHLDPSPIDDKTTGDVACDSYNKYQDDVKILKDIGAHAYRFSISWARILPKGTLEGGINEAGIEYYNNLINSLIDNDISPMITLYHWDLPQGLMNKTGWPDEEVIGHFVDFANLAFDRFGDRVKKWITFNEPWVVCAQGYQTGDKAPAIVDDVNRVYQCVHNIILSHARAYRVYESKYKVDQGGLVGITLDCSWLEPKDPTNPRHLEASERALQFKHGWFFSPIHFGKYPDVMREYVDAACEEEGLDYSRLPEFSAEEVLEINGTYDFLGLNHYTSNLVEDIIDKRPGWFGDQDVLSTTDDSWPYSSAVWLRVVPWGFRKMLKWLKNTYNSPIIYVTENGFGDYASSGIQDTQRVNYYTQYINEMLKAVKLDGVNVVSYTAWSLMDNYEWRRGYTQRFGVHYIDFSTENKTRVPKASAVALKKIYADNGFIAPDATTTTTTMTTITTTPTPSSSTETPSTGNHIFASGILITMTIILGPVFEFIFKTTFKC